MSGYGVRGIVFVPFRECGQRRRAGVLFVSAFPLLPHDSDTHTQREKTYNDDTPGMPAGRHTCSAYACVCVPHAHTLLYARSFAIDEQTHWFTCRSLTSDQPPPATTQSTAACSLSGGGAVWCVAKLTTAIDLFAPETSPVVFS